MNTVQLALYIASLTAKSPVEAYFPQFSDRRPYRPKCDRVLINIALRNKKLSAFFEDKLT